MIATASLGSLAPVRPQNFPRLSLRRCILIIFFFGFLCLHASEGWHNALAPKGEPAKIPLPLVQDGKPAAGILCTEDATPNDKQAATELQKWIREITGATLPIYFGGAPGRNILIRTDPRLGDEGYSIKPKELHVLLWGGKTRGLMNGVYALLEEDLGCRFYTKDSIVLPKTNTLIIAPVERRYVPPLRLRDPFYACAFDADWSLRNRANAPRAKVPEEFGGHIDYDGMFVHTAKKIVPPEIYLKSNPEYFAQLADGRRTPDQLCSTHPEVARLAIDYVRGILKTNATTEIVSISRNDNTAICHCERCAKLRAQEGSEMGNQLFLVNKVAEAIEREFPNVTIDTLAYQVTSQPPSSLRPRKNVAIRLCNDSAGAWKHPFTPAEECEIAKLMAAWSAAQNRIYIWDYSINFSHYLAPMPNLDVMAANIRFWIASHAEGVMLQGGYQGPSERDELKSWVTAKLLWDPSWNETALTQDFIWGHYGQAAPALMDYEELLRKMRTDFTEQMASPAGGIRYPMDSPFLTREFVKRATEIFLRGKELARNDELLIRRVERAQLPLLYLQCARGPEFVGKDYPKAVSEFERIARRENIQHLSEGKPDFETRLKEFKKHIGKLGGD
jgi:hypothetical protein